MSWRLVLCVRERAPVPTRTSVAAAFDVEDDPVRASPVFELGRPATGSTCVLAADPSPATDAARRDLPTAPAPSAAPSAGPAPPGWRATPWILELPLVRAPWLARDLLPAAAHAAAALDGMFVPLDGELPPVGAAAASGEVGPAAAAALIDAWDRAHAAGLAELRARCAETGSPPPPFAPRAVVDAVHAWLIALAAIDDPRAPPFLHGLDPRDGGPAVFAARFPVERGAARLPPFPVLLDPRAVSPVAPVAPVAPAAAPMDEAPLLFPFADVAGDAPVDAAGLALVQVDDALRARVAAARGEALDRYRFVAPVEVIDEESWSA